MDISESFKGKIIVMDDEVMVRDILSDMLEILGYDSECVEEGQGAIDAFGKAKDSGETVLALILDLSVPGRMGGSEATKKILEIDPSAKVIISSGHTDAQEVREYRAHGFAGVVMKPYDFEGLKKILEEVIGEVKC